tara:strand:+ start:653 stop:1033 length:381 start_codon:yes stop_codon:yes gene_type:complete
MYAIQNDILWQSIKTNDWKNVEFYPTPNKKGGMEPTSIVVRHVDTVLGAQALAQYIQKPDVALSGHINIDSQGIVTQNVEFIVEVDGSAIFINLCDRQEEVLEEVLEVIQSKYMIKDIITHSDRRI